MAYTPTTWASGDIISAEKLNKIEQGIVETSSSGGGGGIFVIEGTGITPADASTITFSHNKTLQEVIEAYKSGKQIYFYYENETTPYGFSLNSLIENVDQNGDTTAMFSGYGNFKQSGMDYTYIAKFSEDYVITLEMNIGGVIKFTYDKTTSKYICSHSFSIIGAMLALSDDVPHAVLDNDGNKIELTYNGVIRDGSDVYIKFQNCTVDNNALGVTTLKVPPVGDVSYSYEEFALTQ